MKENDGEFMPVVSDMEKMADRHGRKEMRRM